MGFSRDSIGLVWGSYWVHVGIMRVQGYQPPIMEDHNGESHGKELMEHEMETRVT